MVWGRNKGVSSEISVLNGLRVDVWVCSEACQQHLRSFLCHIVFITTKLKRTPDR